MSMSVQTDKQFQSVSGRSQHRTTPTGLISLQRGTGGHSTPPGGYATPGYLRTTPPGLCGHSRQGYHRCISEPQRGSPRIAGGFNPRGNVAHPRRNPGGVGRCTLDVDSCGWLACRFGAARSRHWTTPSGLISRDRSSGGYATPGYSRATPPGLGGLLREHRQCFTEPHAGSSRFGRLRSGLEPHRGSPRIAGGCITPGNANHPRRNPGGVGRCGEDLRLPEPIHP